MLTRKEAVRILTEEFGFAPKERKVNVLSDKTPCVIQVEHESGVTAYSFEYKPATYSKFEKIDGYTAN